ncbi:HA1F protein, partial [Nyctiprogne leucopyga]|nr:HA1F protein [Nyctiprogne leucopyga]
LKNYVSVGYVDGIPFVRYDSESREMRPQVDWMVGNVDQQYWDSETQRSKHNQEVVRVGLVTL